MDLNKILSIISAGVTILEANLSGEAKADVDIAANLLKIAQDASAAYQAHTGEPIDPSLLQPIDKVE